MGQEHFPIGNGTPEGNPPLPEEGKFESIFSIVGGKKVNSPSDIRISPGSEVRFRDPETGKVQEGKAEGFLPQKEGNENHVLVTWSGGMYEIPLAELQKCMFEELKRPDEDSETRGN